jgi:hypothetical protein
MNLPVVGTYGRRVGMYDMLISLARAFSRADGSGRQSSSVVSRDFFCDFFFFFRPGGGGGLRNLLFVFALI